MNQQSMVDWFRFCSPDAGRRPESGVVVRNLRGASPRIAAYGLHPGYEGRYI